jgi:hypothetical protein
MGEGPITHLGLDYYGEQPGKFNHQTNGGCEHRTRNRPYRSRQSTPGDKRVRTVAPASLRPHPPPDCATT